MSTANRWRFKLSSFTKLNDLISKPQQSVFPTLLISLSYFIIQNLKPKSPKLAKKISIRFTFSAKNIPFSPEICKVDDT